MEEKVGNLTIFLPEGREEEAYLERLQDME
jgi:hypothetical protein